jgi:hypothetical protein
MVGEMHAVFLTGKTKDVEFRIQQLKVLYGPFKRLVLRCAKPLF